MFFFIDGYFWGGCFYVRNLLIIENGIKYFFNLMGFIGIYL